jgi:hypothetical protein
MGARLLYVPFYQASYVVYECDDVGMRVIWGKNGGE